MKKFFAVEYAYFFVIQEEPGYSNSDILNGEIVGFEQARFNAELIVKLLNEHYQKQEENKRREEIRAKINNLLSASPASSSPTTKLKCDLDEQQCRDSCEYKGNRKNCPHVTSSPTEPARIRGRDVDKLTWGEVIRAFKPDASDEFVDFFLWECTCYPFDNETTLQQIESYFTKKQNDAKQEDAKSENKEP